MLSWRISSVVKRKETWRRAFSWLSHQDCPIAGSLHSAALRPDMLPAYSAGSHLFLRAHLHQLAVPSLVSADEPATLLDEGMPDLETAAKENFGERRGIGGKFVVEDDLGKIVGNLIRGSRYRDKDEIRIAMAALCAFQGRMHTPTLHSVMEEFRMQPGTSKIAEDFMNLMARKRVAMGERSYNCLLWRLCHEDKIIRAFKVLTDLGKADNDARGVMPKPSTRLVDVVLAAANRLNKKEIFYKTLDFMKLRSLRPQASTYLEIIKMAGLKRSLPKLREAWSSAVSDLPPHLPIPLHCERIFILSRLSSLIEALVAFEEMKEAMRFYGWDPERQRSEGKEGVWLDHLGSLCAEEASPEASEDGQVRLIGGTCQVAGRGWDATSNLRDVYMSLMGTAASEGNSRALLTLSEEMKELGIEAFSDEVFSNMLLCAAASWGALSDAKEIAASMMERSVAIQPKSYSLWIKACCKIGNVNTAEGLLAEAVSKKVADSTMFHTLMHACIRKHDRQRGCRVAGMMKEARLKPSQEYFATLFGLVGLARKKMPENEVRIRIRPLLLEKKRKGITHSCASFHAMVWTLGSTGLIPELMEQSQWARGLRQNLQTPLLSYLVYNTAIHACLRLDKMAAFKKLMQMLEKDEDNLGMNVHRALMKEKSYGNSDLQSARKVLEALPSIGREPDLTIFNFLIQVMCHDNNLLGGVRLLHRMVAQGVERDRNTYMFLIACAARQADLMPMEKLVDDMHREGFAGDVDTCLAVMTAHVRDGRHEIALRLLESLLSQRRKTPGAVENGSEALFEGLEKWIAKDRETYVGNVVEGKDTKHDIEGKVPILDVEKTEQEDSILDVKKVEHGVPILDVKKEEDPRRRIHMLMWRRRKTA